MANISVIKLKVRRGTDSDRKLITLDNGELGFVTDSASRRLFVGDGVKRGGYPAGSKFYYDSNITNGAGLNTAQVGDLIYSKHNFQLYALTGTDVDGFPAYDSQFSYAPLSPRVDNQTIQYLGGTTLNVRYDNVKIKLVSNTLTVDETSLDITKIYLGNLPTSNPGSGKLWIDTTAGNTLKVG